MDEGLSENGANNNSSVDALHSNVAGLNLLE
jgi:hypothetical protein